MRENRKDDPQVLLPGRGRMGKGERVRKENKIVCREREKEKGEKKMEEK